MLEYLKLQNVGPAEEMELDLGTRLNILTGDNGLGKSFLLDAAWFVQTGCWPAEVNSKLTTGQIGVPGSGRKNGISIEKHLDNKARPNFNFNFKSRSWDGHGYVGPPDFLMDSIVVYLMSDGSSAVYDGLRNDTSGGHRKQLETQRAFVFDPGQIWDGLKSEEGKWLCNGLIRDWASWQNKGGKIFRFLKNVLKILSPSSSEHIVPGELMRADLNDVREIPSIKMPYDGEVPVINASSGIRRILSLAYLIVWAWEEHKHAAKLTHSPHTRNICVLIDEIDAHLHPSWQRKIIPAILELQSVLPQPINLQIIGSTHSPLVMSSLEPLFDAGTDAWFDLDLVGDNGHRKVELTKREFEILGDASEWLTSEAFDMSSTVSLEAEQVLDKAEMVMEAPDFNFEEAKKIYDKLVKVLPADDTFFMRWRMVGKQKGWWK